MALIFKKCIFVIIILVCQVTYLTSTCPEVCAPRNDIVVNRKCPYNVTLKEAPNVYNQVSVCCYENLLSSNWTLQYVNKTFIEVIVLYEKTCNTSNVEVDMPVLDIFALSLSNNNIEQIKIDVKNLHLREIDLSSNKLQHVGYGTFNNFLNLRQLLLSKNEIVDINERSFDGLSKLETLDLSRNNLTILSSVFTPLKNLQHLNLSRNKIEFIHENYFNNWLLQHLDVSHNNLQKLAPGALQFLPNLARLLLTDNPHLGINQLDAQLLVGTGRRLQQIDASRTGLCQVPEAFTHSVRFLSLVGNRIASITCGDFDSYPLLQSLDFSENNVATVEEDSLGRLEMLLFLNLNKNLLNNVPRSLPDELKYLSINDNVIKNLTIPDFKGLPNLRILMLKNNKIHFIQDHVFDDLLSLEMLDLSNNPIQTLSPSTFDGPLSLRDLRLCYIKLSVPEQDGSFPMSSPESVQMLHLQSSPGLARQLLADSAALAAFSHLQYLDLRMNNLTELRNDLLFYLGQLKTLRLHGNNINCSAELWLKDWMSFNNSLSNGETCYYSTSEAKTEITKYNCTFPETFTISESLPPVNLYSTEMINKLLRYYGYLNNKSDKSYKRVFNKLKHEYKHANNETQDKISLVSNKIPRLETKTHRDQNDTKNLNKMSISEHLNETVFSKVKDSARLLDQNKLQNDQFGIDHRYVDTDVLSLQARNSKKDFNDSDLRMNKSGRRLNTPVNNKSKLNTSKNVNESKDMFVTPVTALEGDRSNATGDGAQYTPRTGDKTEYSPYQATDTNYAQYIMTAAVCTLIVMCLILWVSFRRRHRRRVPSALDIPPEDQIEVSNISGGVLW